MEVGEEEMREGRKIRKGERRGGVRKLLGMKRFGRVEGRRGEDRKRR